MNFADKIQTSLIRLDFTAVSKDDALRRIAALAATSPRLESIGAESLYVRLAEREAAVSTGIGHGVAIPHARIAGLDDFVVLILIAPQGVDFAALDRHKVQIFFVVFGPEERVSEHLKILATISRAMSRSGLRRELLGTTSPRVLQEVIARATDDGPAGSPDADHRHKLLCLMLYYEDDLRAVLEFLIDQGIEGATIIESKGMGAYVSSMPLFASFLGFMREDRNACNTVLTLVPAAREKTILEGIEHITGDLDKKQGALILSLDVSFHRGTLNMI